MWELRGRRSGEAYCETHSINAPADGSRQAAARAVSSSGPRDADVRVPAPEHADKVKSGVATSPEPVGLVTPPVRGVLGRELRSLVPVEGPTPLMRCG